MSRKWSSSTCGVKPSKSAARAAIKASRIAASGAISSRNLFRGRTSVSVGSSAAADADGRAVEQGQLAEEVPRSERGQDRLVPVSEGRVILTAPDMTTNRASPGSPRWKITSPRRKRRDRIRGPRCRGSSASSPLNSGTAARVVSERAGLDHARHRTCPCQPAVILAA